MQIFLTSIVTAKFIAAFSRMLIHSLWMGLLMAVVVAAFMVLAKRWDAEKKYNALLFISTLFLFSCMIAFMCEWNRSESSRATTITGDNGKLFLPFLADLHGLQQILHFCINRVAVYQHWIFTGWLLVLVYKMFRTIFALLYNQQVKKRLVYEPDEYWKDRIAQLAEKLQIQKAVVLLQSGICKVPLVTGHLKPVILVPMGLLAGLPPDQMEAILLHELAHIRRNDYLVNLIQHITEAVFFFNPGVWWIAALIREERENCCDDIALSQTNNRRGLAEALISFKTYELYAPALATAFPGRKNLLLRRVSRILDYKTAVTGSAEKLFLITSTALLVFTGTMTMLIHAAKTASPSAAPITTSTLLLQLPVDVVPLPDRTIQNNNTQKKAVHIETIDKPAPIVEVQLLAEREHIAAEQQQIITEQQMAEQDKIQALLREQVMKDQQLAKANTDKAYRDQVMAMIDQARAKTAQEKAAIDQQMALLQQARAVSELRKARDEQEQLQAKIRLQQAMIDKKEAERLHSENTSF